MFSKPKHLKQLCAMVEQNIQSVSKLGQFCASLIITYENGHMNFASVFRIGSNFWCTARHNTLPEDLTESPVKTLHLLLSEDIPGVGDSNDPDYSGKLVECDILVPDNRFHGVYDLDDVDPRSGLDRADKSDFVFLLSESDNLTGALLPYSDELKSMDQVGVLGYNLPVVESILERMFGDEHVRLSTIVNLFNRFNKKSLSPGNILDGVSDRIFPHSCSTLHGASGSPVVSLSQVGFFCGIHIGGWSKSQVENNNYNMACSVNHPAFVLEYVKNVLPLLDDKERSQIAPYLKKHEDLINHYKLA
ncbi:hypothetical protein AKO1_005069 [Acrasis kona]|uniref:Serine protease n=1 Tax=Acrasis kona TaxID=1008807 RepID=A0AAW2Z5I9_9EUKA